MAWDYTEIYICIYISLWTHKNVGQEEEGGEKERARDDREGGTKEGMRDERRKETEAQLESGEANEF